MVLISPNDVVRTSAYIPLDFDNLSENEPNYEKFTEIVAMAVDSVERGKYGYDYFYKTLETLKYKYNIPYSIDIIDFEENEDIDYESFSKSVSKVITDFDSSEEIFNTVNNLIDEYDIPRVQKPTDSRYGGTPLKKHLKK